MKKILLTGGAGYIGSHIAVALIENDFEPVIIDNLSNSEARVIDAISELAHRRIRFHKVDCTDKTELRKVITAEKEISGVIHLAAYKAVGESVEKPMKYYDNNVGSMSAVLQIMQEFGFSNLVFSSSCTVYGNADQQPVTEETPHKEAFSPYGFTKQICERMMQDMQHANPGLKQVSLRYFNPIGAHPSGKIGELPLGTPNNLVPFVTQVAAGLREKLTVFGNDYNTPDGTCIRDYIHVMDLAEAHVAALKYMLSSPTSQLDVFNIGTGEGVSVKEIIDIFKDTNKVDLNVEYGPRRAGDVETIFADARKAEKVLRWKAAYSVHDALKDAWKWQKNLVQL